MIKNFSLFKVKEKENPNSPDYLISIKVNDVFATVGAGWIKKTKDNTSYLSCKLSDGYEQSKGFHIQMDSEPSSLSEEERAKIIALRAGNTVKVAVTEDINPDSILF